MLVVFGSKGNRRCHSMLNSLEASLRRPTRWLQ